MKGGGLSSSLARAAMPRFVPRQSDNPSAPNELDQERQKKMAAQSEPQGSLHNGALGKDDLCFNGLKKTNRTN